MSGEHKTFGQYFVAGFATALGVWWAIFLVVGCAVAGYWLSKGVL